MLKQIIRPMPGILVVLLAAGFPLPASAAVVMTNTYYEATLDGACAVGSSCAILFFKIPPGKFVYVERVACDVRTGSSLAFATLGVQEANGSIPGDRNSPLKFVEGPAVTSSKASFIDVEPRMRFTPGSRPRLLFQVSSVSSTDWFVRCQLVGRVSTS